jgi:hypothetical protein
MLLRTEVLQDMTLCLVSGTWRSKGSQCLHLDGSNSARKLTQCLLTLIRILKGKEML